MKKIVILLFLGGIIVLFSYSIGNYFGLESRKAWLISNSLHFLGGAYAFFFIASVFDTTKKYHNTVTSPLFKALFFVFGALTLGVLWEWYELIFIFWDNIFILKNQDVALYVDTMGDLALDLFGALLASFYYLYRESWKK